MADETIREESVQEEGQAKTKMALLDNKLVLLGIIVVLQALMALAIVQFVIAPRLAGAGATAAVVEDGEAPAVTANNAGKSGETPEIGEIVDLGEVMVTLRSDGGAARYVRIDVNLEVADTKAVAAVEKRLPQLRDITIVALSDKSAEDLQVAEGVAALKSELQHKIGEVLPGQDLRNIYFSDLVIQ